MSYSFTKFFFCMDLRKGLYSSAVTLGFMAIFRSGISVFYQSNGSLITAFDYCKPIDILGTMIVLALFLILLSVILESRRLILLFLAANMTYVAYIITILCLINFYMDCKQPTIYFDIILSVWTTYVSIMGMIYYFKKESMEVTVIA